MFGPARTDALKVFIHVPKTAGSTVNAHLAAWDNGQDHLEHFVRKPWRLQRKLRHVGWVSGHLALNNMQTLLAKHTNRPLAFYGLIRDPIHQVASHYNWLIEIGHREGRFFRSHGPRIQDLSKQLQASDNSDPDVVVANIKARRAMFLNLQARFLLGDDLKFSENTGRDRLRQYSGLSHDPAALIEMITGRRPVAQKRENVSPYHFDRGVFDSDQVQTFLRHHLGHDLKLYARISGQPPVSKGS